MQQTNKNIPRGCCDSFWWSGVFSSGAGHGLGQCVGLLAPARGAWGLPSAPWAQGSVVKGLLVLSFSRRPLSTGNHDGFGCFSSPSPGFLPPPRGLGWPLLRASAVPCCRDVHRRENGRGAAAAPSSSSPAGLGASWGCRRARGSPSTSALISTCQSSPGGSGPG